MRVRVSAAVSALVATVALSAAASASAAKIPKEILDHLTPGAPILHTPEHISYPRGEPFAAPEPGPAPMSAWRMTCQGGWQPVQSYPGGYVTGNCNTGWHHDVTVVSGTITTPGHPDNGHFFWGGTVGGNYNGCGWVRDDYILNTGPSVGTTTCSNPSLGAASFGTLFNCRPGYCSGPTNATATAAGCYKYPNVRPWSPSGGPVGPAHFVNSSTPLGWRYFTRYSYGGGMWVEVLNYAPAAGESRWGFIPVSCVYNAPPGPGGYWYP